ncbi:MAG: pyroglutamyl-peptidase I [Dehalococcoidia bacterium]
MRLLLTGFEPFGGETVNPSGTVVRLLAADPPSGVDVTPLELPVRGRVSFELLVPALERGRFDAWLGLGQAGGRPQLSVERTGINVLIERDAETSALDERALVDDGPAAYFSRLPVRDLARRINEAGAPAVVSNTAGTYICNEVTYVVQHYLATSGVDMPGGFIHLPYLPEQTAGKPPATPSMALETQVLGIRAAVEFIRDLVAVPAGAPTAPATR